MDKKSKCNSGRLPFIFWDSRKTSGKYPVLLYARFINRAIIEKDGNGLFER